MNISHLAMARLVGVALDHIAAADAHGCCSNCCPTCWAIRQLRDAGDLDAAARTASGTVGASWWAGDRHTVDRELLTSTWRTTCPDNNRGNHPHQPETRTVQIRAGWSFTTPADVDVETSTLIADELRGVIDYFTTPPTGDGNA